MRDRLMKRIARLTSNTINPFFVSLVMIILLAATAAPDAITAVKWAAITVALSILPVFGFIVFLLRRGKIDSIFIKVRSQRNNIYLLAGCCAALACAVLYFSGGPRILVASMAAGVIAIIIFMVINLWWKISVHTAFVTASVTVLIIVFGAAGFIAALLIPPVAWSRIELKNHSLAQVVAGALAAATIVLLTFRAFGLIFMPL